uniref:Uncharacterized protein n=1 Tax=Ciona intestinalis TaxID=7719 RepID=H2XK47_CIOIN
KGVLSSSPYYIKLLDGVTAYLLNDLNLAKDDQQKNDKKGHLVVPGILKKQASLPSVEPSGQELYRILLQKLVD